ncbi:SDR family oxidoreductase [Magnetospirillum sp. 15-1]|uniref:SDR family NAD(P)-dependent oxidoreductase n=1 Tax=Magnetospirillum sp. 15-1 TaxID=1979370 RepID=UPI000BBC1188|nr:SDR family oxidoreductase [Magnetospirillum sp. 15-1]
MRFKDQVVIVTGGGSGIGAATARIFARDGASVTVADIANQDEVAKEITKVGGKAIAVRCDVSSSDSVQKMIEATISAFGRLDVMVSNAGVGVLSFAEGTSEEDWDRCQAINVKGGFLCAKYAIPHLRNAGGGSILFTASVAGIQGVAGALPYATSKGAVVNMTRTLALDHAHENIRVNVVCPGATDTPLLRSAPVPVEVIAAMQALGRVVTPEEIGEAFAYLASPVARCITGQTLVIDSGASAGDRSIVANALKAGGP